MQKYRSVNGCSKPAPIAQILAISLHIVVLVLVINFLPAVIQTHLALFALMGFDFFALIIVVALYLVLLLGDPADPRLTGEQLTSQE